MSCQFACSPQSFQWVDQDAVTAFDLTKLRFGDVFGDAFGDRLVLLLRLAGGQLPNHLALAWNAIAKDAPHPVAPLPPTETGNGEACLGGAGYLASFLVQVSRDFGEIRAHK